MSQPGAPTVSTARQRARAVAVTAALLGVAAVGLVVHMRRFQFVTDDAFISFVYSRNLARHGELVFNLGERVEGYTNFLWTVLLAGAMKLGWQPESSSIVLGVASAIATQLTLARLSWTVRGGDSPSPWDALPAFALAISPGYACWSSGGLETQLFTFFVTFGSALYLAERDPARPGLGSSVALALAALTRPEGNLFFALVGLHRVLGMAAARRLRPTAREFAWVGVYLALVVPHFLWRHHYYGYWVPNTFYIKSSGGLSAWPRGLYYLRRCFEQLDLWAFVLLGACAAVVGGARAVRRLAGFVALLATVFFLYVASVGGDFMGLFRFALPVVPLLALVAAQGLRRVVEAAARAPVTRVVAGAAAAVALLAAQAAHAARVDAVALSQTSDNGIDSPGWLRYYTEDRAAVGRWFGAHAQPDDYAAVGGAGAQVYYSGMRSLDCYGLSDAYIAHHVQASDNRPGHEKYAPDDYILSRHPTIITSHNYNIGDAPLVRPDEPFWRAHGYHYVAVQVPGLSRPWYSFLKRMDRRVGPLAPVNGDID